MHTVSCRHIKTNGAQCGSPRMGKADFCYFHQRLRQRHRDFARVAPLSVPVLDQFGRYTAMETIGSASAGGTVDIAPLEDRESVQMAISVVVNALASGQLETRRATALLYGLQLASANCAGSRGEPASRNAVRSTVMNAEGEQIAPEGEPERERDLLPPLGEDDSFPDLDDALRLEAGAANAAHAEDSARS